MRPAIMPPTDIFISDDLRCAGPQIRGVNDSDYQRHHSYRLVRKGEQSRYVRDERCDAECRLQ
jgi:hypothetical protein